MSEWQIAGFAEVRELGAGAQGRVVLARHEESGAPVAIKYVTSAAGRDVARLRHEARLLGQVADPHVARLYRLVESEHGAAIVMEAVDGVSLRRVLAERGSLTPEQSLLVLKGSLAGLAAAHAAGVVHRDYKPANVVVRADGLSKLIDFGIAVPVGEQDRSGTPAYMAPEQWRGEPVTPAADVYAATCVFFECLTGRRPFTGDLGALRSGHLDAPPPVEDVPDGLRELLARGMAKTPDGRPAGAAVFVQELESAATAAYGTDWEARGVQALAGAAVALAAVFPLAAAGIAPVAAGGAVAAGGTAAAGGAAAAAGGTTAAGGAAAGAGGTAAAGSGILAGVGAKVAVAVAGTAVVAGAGGTAVYSAGHGRDEPRVRPVAATVSTQNETLSGVPVAVRAQYAQISGHRDPAVQRRINQELRAPLDWSIDRIRQATARSRAQCSGQSRVSTAVRMGVRGPSLISVVYKTDNRYCFPADGALPGWAVTLDLKTGRAYTAEDIFKPSTLTSAGLQVLWSRLTSKEGTFWGPDGCMGDHPPQRSDFLPSSEPTLDGGRQKGPPYATVFLAPDHFEVNWSTEGSACTSDQLTGPYAKVRDLLEPDFAALLPG
ncbi:serine/threonine-protein kinase [Actinomadura xylanilytica]|uniref:serine/threonine-protein kinase n=1 Tax=Actinomadura xylanilytica TaxID=887459 RepID=UPI00255AD56C|nr:serine/threonine-protein kinase [Actinomadura xylanilytica]MDL4772558.1 serine/threonine-protein kinase [Actinomadura xylanilytica]